MQHETMKFLKKLYIPKIIAKSRIKQRNNVSKITLMQLVYKNIIKSVRDNNKHIRNKQQKKQELSNTTLFTQYMFSAPRIVQCILFLFIFVTNILTILNINYLYLSSLLSSIYLLLIPGFLFLWVILSLRQSFWEIITYSLGISIVLLMLLGLFINWILPFSGVSHPLTFLPILLSIDAIVFISLIVLFLRNKPLPFDADQKINVKTLTYTLVLSMVLPTLSILGAISLNNNGSNIFTIVLLGLIAFTVFILTVLRNKMSENIFPIAILMIGISLLFMTSLRGWYVTGHDINLETYVFQLTKSHGLWSMANFPDPYNACLSITILPTIISLITHIPDFYVYKIVYQLIFSFSAVLTYLFLKKFLNPFLAFLGSFIIVSLPTFMTDMPMLNRQEIAFIFFTLLLNVLFAKKFSRNLKWFLFLLFGTGLTLSHYSTTYITLGLFIGASLLYLSINIIRFHPSIKAISSAIDNKLGIEHNITRLELGMVIILAAITIIWNFTITHTSNGITSTITNIENDLTSGHIAKSKNDPASYGLLHIKKPSQKQLLSGYVDNLTKYVRKFNTDAAFFPQYIWSQFPVTLGSATTLPLSPFGIFLEKHHINPSLINNFLKDAYAKTIQILIVIGLLFIFWYKKHIKEIKKEHLTLIFVFFILLIAQTVLPSNSINYGILRLFQQGLILLIIPLIIGALSIFSIFDKINKGIKVYLLSLLFIFYFLYLSGFLPTLTGGYYPQLNLSNSGFYYEAYYTHQEEIVSIKWLLKRYDKKIPIQSDWFTGNKFHTYGGIYTLNTLIPSAIRINSYVYVSYSNIQTGQMMVYVNGAPIYYHFPFSFLDKNKNLIYDNGGTKIYR